MSETDCPAVLPRHPPMEVEHLDSPLTRSSGEPRPPVVLHVRVMSGYGGGPEKTILNSPRFLRRLGYHASCAYMHPPDAPGFAQLQQRALAAEAEVLSIEDRGPFDWRVVTALHRICRDLRVDVWHGHDYKSNAIGLLIRRFRKMKLITTVHGWVERTSKTPLYYVIDKACLPRYDQVVCVSEDLLEECQRLGIEASRCQLIKNAIDTDEFRRTRPAQRRSSSSLQLAAVGRLSPEKGFDVLIHAVAQLVNNGRNVYLRIAGEGRDRDRLTRIIGELEMHEHVQLVGFVADPKTFIEEADLFVLSSLREGLPNVVLEAMSLEVPVVATSIAGVPQLIQNETNGILVPPNSVDGLVEAIKRVMDDDSFRSAMAAAGRATIERDYSFHHRMSKMAKLYDRLLNRNANSEGATGR